MEYADGTVRLFDSAAGPSSINCSAGRGASVALSGLIPFADQPEGDTMDNILGLFEKLESQSLAVQPNRCVVVRNRNATCRRCAEACPTGAIAVAGNDLAVAPERCVGCGTCATVCPTAALEAKKPDDKGLLEGGCGRHAGQRRLAVVMDEWPCRRPPRAHDPGEGGGEDSRPGGREPHRRAGRRGRELRGARGGAEGRRGRRGRGRRGRCRPRGRRLAGHGSCRRGRRVRTPPSTARPGSCATRPPCCWRPGAATSR
ncbi:MAG: 4Fe-4S dicluster domain-containing protein [Adlercreutzia equolifaciens]